MKIFLFFKLIRPVNVLITILSTYVAIIISSARRVDIPVIIFACVATALTAAAGNIINDIYDIETDKINKPDRPVANGSITIQHALVAYFIINLTALTFSILISTTSLMIVLLSQVLLYFYSYKLKKLVLAGNITIAFLTGMVFIYGGIITGNFLHSLIPAGFAFLINLIRELVKDIEDTPGDLMNSIITFPSRYSVESTRYLIHSLSILVILLSFYPFLFNFYKIEFFIIVMVIVNPMLVLLNRLLYKDKSVKNLSRISGILKIDMVVGLIAIYAGR